MIYLGVFYITAGLLLICFDLESKINKKMENHTGMELQTGTIEGFNAPDGSQIKFIVGVEKNGDKK